MRENIKNARKSAKIKWYKFFLSIEYNIIILIKFALYLGDLRGLWRKKEIW